MERRFFVCHFKILVVTGPLDAIDATLALRGVGALLGILVALDADFVDAPARGKALAALLPLHAPGLRLVRGGVVEAPEDDALAGPRLGVLLVL